MIQNIPALELTVYVIPNTFVDLDDHTVDRSGWGQEKPECSQEDSGLNYSQME